MRLASVVSSWRIRLNVSLILLIWDRRAALQSSIYVFSYFPFGFEGWIWDLIVSVPDHCLSFYSVC